MCFTKLAPLIVGGIDAVCLFGVVYHLACQLCNRFCNQSGIPCGNAGQEVYGRNKSYRRYVNEIAAFYGVSVDYLLGNADSKEKQPDSQNENQAVKDELIAFYGDVKDDLTPDDIDDLMVAMRAKAERNKKKKSGV